MSSNPKVSVLMPVYNAERFLREAIESILAQSFSNFEFVIIDDGSEDGSVEILDWYRSKDSRIVLLPNGENVGIARSLNRGLEIARAEYIARQDADDVSLPKRLEKQTEIMESHREIGLLGTGAFIISESGEIINSTMVPTNPGHVRWCMLFNNCISHSSVMIRHSVFETVGDYSRNHYLVEDYELWLRIADVADMSNINQPLIYRRKGEHRVSSKQPRSQEEATLKLVQSNLSRILHRDVPLDVVIAIRQTIQNLPVKSPDLILEISGFLLNLYREYLGSQKLASEDIQKITQDLSNKLHVLAGRNYRISPLNCLKVLISAERLSPRLPKFQTIHELFN